MDRSKEIVLYLVLAVVAVSLVATFTLGGIQGDVNQINVSADADTVINVFGNGNANIVGTIRSNTPVPVEIVGIQVFDGTTFTELDASIITNQTLAPYGSTSIKGVLQDANNADPATRNVKLTRGNLVDIIIEVQDNDGKTDAVSLSIRGK